jgi:hypothetical protein
MDALPDLEPVTDAYASLPIADAFNWQDASRALGDGEWYLVAFRSIRRPDADEVRLNAYDDLAHVEAAAAPGFVHYFKGPAASDGSCLSFCLGQSRAEARSASGGAAHRQAVGILQEMYAQYALEFHRVRRQAGGALTFEPYDVPEPAPMVPPTTRDVTPTADGPRPGLTIRPAPAF